MTVKFFFLAMVASVSCFADPILIGSFEENQQAWTLFVPTDSATCGVTYSTSRGAARDGQVGAVISSSKSARTGLYPKANPIAVKAGERYRFSAWIRASATFKVDTDTPGVILRATLFSGPKVDFPGGHLFVGIKGVAQWDPKPLSGASTPTTWTKLEGVFEIPDGAHEMIPFLFCWRSSGELFVDDISVEKVESTIALTPILR